MSNETIVSTAPINPEIQALTEEIELLRARLNEALDIQDATREELKTTIANYQNDISTIARHLVRAAREYEWCSTYDSKVEEINEELTIKLPPRTKRFLVQGAMTISINTVAELDFDATENEAKNWLYDIYGIEALAEKLQFHTREFEVSNVREY